MHYFEPVWGFDDGSCSGSRRRATLQMNNWMMKGRVRLGNFVEESTTNDGYWCTYAAEHGWHGWQVVFACIFMMANQVSDGFCVTV